jgi:hypothetical protein
MCFNRPWKVIAVIALAQVAIIACYVAVTTGDAAPVMSEPLYRVKKTKASTKKKGSSHHVKQNHGPKLMHPDPYGTVAPIGKVDSGTPPADKAIKVEDNAKGKVEAPPPDKGPAAKGTQPSDPPALITAPAAPDIKGPMKPVGSPDSKDGDTAATSIPAVLATPPAKGITDATPLTSKPPEEGPGHSPKTTVPAPPTVPPPGETAPPDPPVDSPKNAATTSACPWTLRIGLVAGKTHLTAAVGKEIRFKVICDQLNLQAPCGKIEAQGCVKVSSLGLDGSCDRLTINWQEDQVILVGQAQLKCQREGQDVELKADRLGLRLTPGNVKKAARKEGNHKVSNKTNGKRKKQASNRHSVSFLPPSGEF